MSSRDQPSRATGRYHFIVISALATQIAKQTVEWPEIRASLIPSDISDSYLIITALLPREAFVAGLCWQLAADGLAWFVPACRRFVSPRIRHCPNPARVRQTTCGGAGSTNQRSVVPPPKTGYSPNDRVSRMDQTVTHVYFESRQVPSRFAL